MKLNNKGYLIVEVILAGVLTFTMAYFLINLTLKIRNRYDDGNVETVMLNDKTIITNEIMSDVIDNKIISVDDITNGIKISFEDGSSKDLTIVGNTINYGSYTKKLSDNAIVGDINIKRNGNYFLLEIPITTKYSDKDFGINIFGFTKDTSQLLTCSLSASDYDITSSFDGNMVYYGWNKDYSGDNSTTMAINAGTHVYYIKDAFGKTGSCSITIVDTVDGEKTAAFESWNNGSCTCRGKSTGNGYPATVAPCNAMTCNCPSNTPIQTSQCTSVHTGYYCEKGQKLSGSSCIIIKCPDGYTKINEKYCYKK